MPARQPFPPDHAPEALLVADWRLRVAALYANVRNDRSPERAWRCWRDARDELFARHAASPLSAEQRARFTGLDYYPYDPAARVVAALEPLPEASADVPVSAGKPQRFARIGLVRFEVRGAAVTLDVHWLETYGNGLFLPVADATSGEETYGGGRYLLDTVKGADLGRDTRGRLVLDLNFVYQPSCAYEPRWSCPLAPPGNRTDVSLRVGERLSGAATPHDRSLGREASA